MSAEDAEEIPSAPEPLPTAGGAGWQRLDPRTILSSVVVLTALLIALGIVTAVIMLLAGVGVGQTLLWVGLSAVALILGVVATEWIRLRTTSYRLDETRIERRIRFLSTSRTSLARDRIRNVELSSDLVQRMLGLVVVKLATAEGEGERLSLQALDRSVAEQLRADLLGDRATAETGTLATIDWSWLRYAPVSLATGAIGLGAYSSVLQAFDWFSAVPVLITWVTTTLGALPLLLLIPVLLLGALLIGAVATTALYIEGWWAYRLGRHEDGSLDLRRGLLVSRSTVFEGDRLRGVTLHEPLGLRRVRGARLDVIAVGMGVAEGNEQNAQSPALVPASPREVSARVAETILGAPVPTALHPHPPTARRKRSLRAAASTLGITALSAVPLLWWPGLWWIPVITLVLIGAVATVLALDNSRGLGHLVTERHVVLRKGSLFRRTDVLTREGLIGWNLVRSPFQRRVGLGTVVATSAGGSGAFRLPDVDGRQASDLMGSAGQVWDHLRRDLDED